MVVEEEIVGNFTILIILKDLCIDVVWMLTGVYGPSSTYSREEFWTELKNLNSRWKGP